MYTHTHTHHTHTHQTHRFKTKSQVFVVILIIKKRESKVLTGNPKLFFRFSFNCFLLHLCIF